MAHYPVCTADRLTTTSKHFTGHSVKISYSHSSNTLKQLSVTAFLSDPHFFVTFLFFHAFVVFLFLFQKGSELRKAGQLLPPCGQAQEH